MAIANVELTLEQRLTAKRVFAAADPRRTLVAFYLIDGEPKTESALTDKLWKDYGEVAGLLQPWPSNHRYIGSICEKSLSSIGLVESSGMVLPHPIKGAHTASAWKKSELVESLRDYVLFIHNAANSLGASSYALFTHLAGHVSPQERLQAPFNKARIILDLARLANYEAGSEIRMRDVEKATGLTRSKIQGHLEQFEAAGLVILGFFPSLEGGKNFYKWASPDPPPPSVNHLRKAKKAARQLYEARNDQPLGTAAFCPDIFSDKDYAFYAIRKLVKLGLVEEGTRYYFMPVVVNQLCLDVADKLVGKVFGAIKGDENDLAVIRASAAEFKSNERQGLRSMIEHYVTASKTI